MSYHPVVPHKYPLWIKISFVIYFYLFFCCLCDFPYFFNISKDIKRAHSAFKNNNYNDARIYYAELSTQLPNNKHIKLYLAQSLFKSKKREDHMIALESLESLQLSDCEWSELLRYMPFRYVGYFHNRNKKDMA